MKDQEANTLAIEKSQIEVLIEKHRPHTPKTPDEVSTGKNAKVDGQKGNKKEKPPYKKATKDIQIKMSRKKGKEAENAKSGNTDTLLGDLRTLLCSKQCSYRDTTHGARQKENSYNRGIYYHLILRLQM